ncbi:MAG: hypothetical protein QOE91_1483 [Gaiellaceae bacterium]|jgi:hypothetical protein|nr:hypothetical protein [Gaiellaceae bacterium]
MGEAYRIGISAGAGVAIGVVVAGLIARLPRGGAGAAFLAAVIAGVLGWIVFGWPEAVAGAIGGGLGGASAAILARGALRRGGTTGGTTVLFGLAGVVLFLVALIPVAGYLEAVAVPIVAARARRRAGEKYAGLRSLAR